MGQTYKNIVFMHIHMFHTLNETSQVKQATNNCNDRNIQSHKLTTVNLAQAKSSRLGEFLSSWHLKFSPKLAHIA